MVDGTKLAFWKLIIRLGYIYPVLSLRNISCPRYLKFGWQLKFQLGEAQKGRGNEGVLEMWMTGWLYYIHCILSYHLHIVEYKLHTLYTSACILTLVLS
jgi:hypothetical protein